MSEDFAEKIFREQIEYFKQKGEYNGCVYFLIRRRNGNYHLDKIEESKIHLITKRYKFFESLQNEGSRFPRFEE